MPLWEASDRLCGKRLAALLPLLLESLERHGHLALEPGVRQKLLTISSATIDRLLAPVRKSSPANGWRRPPRARSAVARRTPVRTFNGWGKVSEAGWLEIDLVAHCGKWMEGRFLWTLVATDIATGWSECLPLLSRDGASVMAALRLLEELLPFPLRGIDVDNDGAFMNAPLESWCEKHRPRIELTRSLAYQSNDQAWVERKNGMLVRRVIGYQRLEGLAAAELLGELYGALRLFTNLFQPSFKLKETLREGARLKRRHHPPRTPQQRLLALEQLTRCRPEAGPGGSPARQRPGGAAGDHLPLPGLPGRPFCRNPGPGAATRQRSYRPGAAEQGTTDPQQVPAQPPSAVAEQPAAPRAPAEAALHPQAPHPVRRASAADRAVAGGGDGHCGRDPQAPDPAGS